MAALSLASDLGMGQPLEFALSSCVLALRLGEALRLSEEALREIYYQALLRYIGCNAETHLVAAIVGDEIALRADFATIDNASITEVVSLMVRTIRQTNAGAGSFQVMQAVARGLLALPQMEAIIAGHCEVAQRLAERLDFSPNIVHALGQLYERWDGKGSPKGLKGEAIAPAVLVVTLAQDALVFHRLGGVEAAVAIARKRKGAAYAPQIVECFCQHAPSLCSGLDTDLTWETVLALEPGRQESLSEAQFDSACRAMADFADLKSTFTLGHSSGVAVLAAAAGRQGGLPAADVIALRRAAMLHDVGRTGVSTGIWDKPGPLSERDWERVRMHPYYTERILARPPALARLGALAGLHHERLDGSGYHRGLPAAMLSPAARILAAADVYHALTEPRPHRLAFSVEAAAEEIRREVRAGRLDSEAVNCVLAAAGHRVQAARRELVAGLSERELEVLRLLARGHSTRQIAEALVISPKTADHHIQHIYAKIGVSTRAGATLYALEHDLMAEP
ncbi:MAG: HD domain-containing protein [Anaerolineales bacterium]|nr:HD domain-containing protein [Anaerolineales bacterium]